MNETVSVNKVLRKALDEEKMKQSELAQKLGTQQSTVSVLFHRQRIGASILVSVLNVMGYTVMVGKKTDDGFDPVWELEPEEE